MLRQGLGRIDQTVVIVVATPDHYWAVHISRLPGIWRYKLGWRIHFHCGLHVAS